MVSTKDALLLQGTDHHREEPELLRDPRGAREDSRDERQRQAAADRAGTGYSGYIGLHAIAHARRDCVHVNQQWHAAIATTNGAHFRGARCATRWYD